MPKGQIREADGAALRVAVLFVGNKLYLDDGVGPAAYEEVCERFDAAPSVSLHDVGCLSMDMLPLVDECDVIITVDAVEGTGHPAGTVLRYTPDEVRRAVQARTSLHDMRLGDLFDAAALLGYEAQGICLGMQVENAAPVQITIGLTPSVNEALPLLIEALAAELAHLGVPFSDKQSGCPIVGPGA